MFTLVFCLQTIKRNEPAPHLDAFLDQQLLSLTLHGRSTAFNCAITTVQWIIIYPTVNGQSHRTIPTTSILDGSYCTVEPFGSSNMVVIWALVQIYFGIVQSTV